MSSSPLLVKEDVSSPDTRLNNIYHSPGPPSPTATHFPMMSRIQAATPAPLGQTISPENPYESGDQWTQDQFTNETKSHIATQETKAVTLPRLPLDPPRRFTCTLTVCGKKFRRREHLKRHIQSVHTNEKPFRCEKSGCNKRFSRNDNLTQHQSVHERNEAGMGPTIATKKVVALPPPSPERIVAKRGSGPRVRGMSKKKSKPKV